VILRLQNGDLQQVQDSMPNLLTPNGDGENDVFDPLKFLTDRITLTEEEIRGARLSIINRWGEVVYRPYPYLLWDGLHGRGDGERPLPQATYYYLLQFTIGGKQEQIRGAVNLLR
jgi:gliding motility-associated-like protein